MRVSPLFEEQYEIKNTNFRIYFMRRNFGERANAFGFCASDKPFYFSAKVAEGNYKFTITFGDKSDATETTVKAEVRRLMLEKVSTAKGKFATESFIVNVRNPQISTGGEVKLKAMSKQFYEALGKKKSGVAFKEGEATHHSKYGSYELAKMIVEGVKNDNLPIAKYLINTSKFDPSKPDSFDNFAVPASPTAPTAKPLGS